ncbi:hypothetical protein JWH16_13330 [Xanthomonas campestris pv. campestris]|uniref:hypothetical protein n=1 Tax=Xanthomonas campestris TaxID=339 RepID=UPI001E2D6D5A|nr:hypothetical protein [Xanthomonas campestris]MCD0254771.1 hypothetical protein [Xanthomonas campestris pv. campestris]MEB1300191.1 hypothetical protein [Xanthomonas campestris pv. campestris]MEB1308985.1 hypothetical protein [Xanthomonas campestris pv. campestris]MEB1334084.1 hypothetical protein [Xanthomonas campestris pv. campestris]MEB1899972.1 hypothetical protein [Xanthomonas campestris pv. campestris]
MQLLTLAAILVGAAGVCLVRHPSVLFAYQVSHDELTLHSDQPLDADATHAVLALAQDKLRTSEFYVEGQTHAIYLCNSDWRQRLFFSYAYGVGGINYYPGANNIFLRNASVEHNRLIGPDGRNVTGARTLDYFIAHEVAHTLSGQALGWWRFHRLPRWKREGYADYVGYGGPPDFVAARKALRDGDARMDWNRSQSYDRYHLMVSYLIDTKGWTALRMFEEQVDESDLVAELSGQ